MPRVVDVADQSACCMSVRQASLSVVPVK
jgi:hypothetical protein